MPIYKVTDERGRTLTLEGDSEPTDDELEELFSSQPEPDEPATSETRTAQATIPDSLQLKPQFGNESGGYSSLMRPPQIPEHDTRAQAEGGALGDAPAPIPDQFRAAEGPSMGSGYNLPEFEQGSDPRMGQRIEPQGKLSQFIEETAQAPVRFGMMRKGPDGEYHSDIGPTEVTSGPEGFERSHTSFDLPMPSDWITKYATKEGNVQDISVGLRNSAASFMNFFLSPQGAAMAGNASAKAAQQGAKFERGGDIAPLLEKLRDPANRSIAGGFALDMAKHAPESLQAGDDAMRRGDLAGAIEHWSGGAASLVLAGMSAKHATMPKPPARGGTTPVEDSGATLKMPMEIEKPAAPTEAPLISEAEAKNQGPHAILHIMADHGVDRDTAVAMQAKARKAYGISKEAGAPDNAPRSRAPAPAPKPAPVEGPLSAEETTQFSALQKKFFEGGEMEQSEIDALDAFDARNRTQMQSRVNAEPAEGMVGEAERLLNEAVQAEGVGDIVEMVNPKDIHPESPMFYRLANFNTKTGKIQINGRALAQDLAGIPADQRAKFMRSLINEEAVHSGTTPADAVDFHNNATWAEKKLSSRIYSGNWGGKLGGKKLSPAQLGYEMIRRRIQRLNRITPTELVGLVGREKWTRQSLDVLDRSISKSRELLGTNASKAQLALMDKVQKNIKVARGAVENLNIGAPRRETDDLVGRLRARKDRVTTDEAVQTGIKAESVADLDALADGWREWKSDLNEAKAKAKANPSAMMEYAAVAQRGQLFREAIEAATNTGSHKMDARVGSEKELPSAPLDHAKNPEVADWLRRNGEELGIELPEGENVGAMRRPPPSQVEKSSESKRKLKGEVSFPTEWMQERYEHFLSRVAGEADLDGVAHDIYKEIDSAHEHYDLVTRQIDSIHAMARNGELNETWRTQLAALRNQKEEVMRFSQSLERLLEGEPPDPNQEFTPEIVGAMRRAPDYDREHKSVGDIVKTIKDGIDYAKAATSEQDAGDAMLELGEFMNDSLQAAHGAMDAVGVKFVDGGYALDQVKPHSSEYAKNLVGHANEIRSNWEKLEEWFEKKWGRKAEEWLSDNPEGENIGAMRRNMTKEEARRIEEQRKYRELMIAKETGGKRSKVEDAGTHMAKRHEAAYPPPTAETIQSFAAETMNDKVPSFSEFLRRTRAKAGHGAVQSGQLTETWADAVWKKLQNATGEELSQMIENLGLRRQVFGQVSGGSTAKGDKFAYARTGTIADAGADTGGPEMARARAMERSRRLSKKADEMMKSADAPVSQLIKSTNPEDYARQVELKKELRQKATILQRTADNLATAAQSNEGMPAQQQSFLLEDQAPAKPMDWRDPSKGTQRKARERAISAIGRHLLAEQPSMKYGLNRKALGPEDIRWQEEGADIIKVGSEPIEDFEQLGMELTRGAASNASTSQLTGGGSIKHKREALPRSATKRVVALYDPRTREVHLVSGYRDGRRGPVFRDPSSVTGEHRTLEQLRRYRPLFSLPLDMPVQDFKQTFKSVKDFTDQFYGQVQQMGRRIGWRGLDSDPRIEGTEGVHGEGGLFMGPEADIARAEQGMVAGARESGADITPHEGRAVYEVFRNMESREDIANLMANLKERAQKNKLTPRDWLLITAMSKVNDSLLELHRGEKGELTSQQIADLTLQELYDLTKRNETSRSFVGATQRQFAEGPQVPADAGPQEAKSPTVRELTMRSRRAPTDVSRAEPGQPEVRTGADPNRPAGLTAERDVPPAGVQRQLYKERSRALRVDATKKIDRKAEFTPMVETPGPRESYVPRERKVEITQEVNKIADRISEVTPPEQPPQPQQGEFDIGALRRLDEKPEFWEDGWRSATKRIGEMIGNAGKSIKDGITEENLHEIRGGLDGVIGTLNTWIRKSGLQMEKGEPLWETARSDRMTQAANFLDLLQQAEELRTKVPDGPLAQGTMGDIGLGTQRPPKEAAAPGERRQAPIGRAMNQGELGIGALRRNSGRTVGERMHNVLTDFGSIYDKWMVDRLDEYGGPMTRQAVRTFRTIIDRQKELYGQLTPTLDRARRLSGGIETNQGTNTGEIVRDLPRQARESVQAMRAAAWLGRLRNVTARTATANSVDAIEGNIHVPPYARHLVGMSQAANLEIGRMLQAVVPGFIATGKWQRNLTGLGYDLIRQGGGDAWNDWTQGVARANRLHGATVGTVRRAFREMKEVLDDPMSTADQIERVNQDMARQFPAAVTHVRQLGRWQEVMHSNLFNYLEQAAQRATHVRAFRESFPNTDAGRAAFRTLVGTDQFGMKSELVPEVQRDLDGLIRALNGHPTDDYSGGWQDYTRMGPQQPAGVAMRMMNQTVNNVLAKAVLTTQMLTQTGEVATGSAPVKLGFRNYLRATARVLSTYNELELFGSVNRVMHDYTFQPNSPIRSIFRIAGNVLSKVTAQAALNELQEALTATTARIVTENIMAGRLSRWQEGMLGSTFREMGFNPAEVRAMLGGDQTLLNQFQRKAASFLTGGNKAIAEGSRLGANRMFNSIFRFQTYPMMKMNQARATLVTLADAWSPTGTAQQRLTASAGAARFFFGNTMQGAITVGLTSLFFGGPAGLAIKYNEAKDEPGKFIAESFLASMSGPFYMLWRGRRYGGSPTQLAKGMSEQALRAAFPYAVMNELGDMADGVGKYRDKDTSGRIGTFLASKTPATQAISTGLAAFGLANKSQPLDQALNGFYRWRRDEMGFKEESRHLKNDEREQFRNHVANAIDAMKEGDTERYVDEWLKAVDAKDQSSFRDSMRGRKVLIDLNGAPLTDELKEKLRNRIGEDAYNRLEWYDLMLDQAARGAIPVN